MSKRMLWSIIGSVVGVVVIAGAVTLYFVFKTDTVAEAPDPKPSGNFSVNPIQVAGDPYKLVAATAANAPGDGAEEIHQAIQSYYKKEGEIEADASSAGDLKVQINKLFEPLENNEDIPAATIPPWRCADLVVASADKGGFNLEKYLAPEDREWVEPYRLCNALDRITKAALIEGRIAENRGDRAQAERIDRAVLIFGVRLTGNKIRVWIRREGLKTQLKAVKALLLLYQDSPPDKKKAAFSYKESVAAALERMNNCFLKLTQPVGHWNVGDLILFAKEHKDPAWRVEVVLTIGMCQWTKDGHEYSKQLNRRLDQAANDSDPSVVKAAEWAKSVTREMYTDQSRKRIAG